MKTQYRGVGLAGLLWLLSVSVPIGALGQPGPGPEHQELKKLEGEWTATVKMGDVQSKGTTTYRMECGGLWLISSFDGEFGGQSFQGRGMDGFDPQSRKYVSVWVDSMSGRPLFLEGEMDSTRKVLTMVGTGVGPDGQPVKYKTQTRFTDADHKTFKMYTVTGGTEAEMLTIEYVRKK